MIIKFMYKNHRDETAERMIVFESITYEQAPEFDYKPGWFMNGFCHDKHARRSFALDNIILPEGIDKNAYELFNYRGSTFLPKR